jgi:hypothetical protein
LYNEQEGDQPRPKCFGQVQLVHGTAQRADLSLLLLNKFGCSSSTSLAELCFTDARFPVDKARLSKKSAVPSWHQVALPRNHRLIKNNKPYPQRFLTTPLRITSLGFGVQMLANKHELLRTKMKHGMQIGKTKNPWQHNDVYR